QRDPVAVAMADFPSRDEEAFYAHWEKVRADPSNILRTVEVDGETAGNLGSWNGEDVRLVGYWIGREHWGKGVATAALQAFVEEIPERPLHALVAAHNAGSIRVLEKAGFVQGGEHEEGPVCRRGGRGRRGPGVSPGRSSGTCPSCAFVEERPSTPVRFPTAAEWAAAVS